MSAGASHTSSPGQMPANNTVPPSMRRRPANPLVKPKRKAQPLRPASRPGRTGTKVNGIATAAPKGLQQTPAAKSSGPGTAQAPSTTVKLEEYIDYPVFTTKRELLEGLRHHVMRFLPNASATVKNVELADESQFDRPVKLHRRDPKSGQGMHWRDGDATDADEDGKHATDDKERERLEAQRADRRAEREANQAQMAPVAKNATVPKKNHFQKKTEQVFQVSDNVLKQKAHKMRYEEALPWHVEDFDGKNIWAGTYESALSDCHVMLLPEGPGTVTHYRMVPVEKWYKFTAKNLFKALSIDEAEARMSKKVKDPRWFMETQSAERQRRVEELADSRSRKLFTRTGERGERVVKAEGDDERGEVVADADDIDYNYEEAFADDEENPIFGGDDEEVKEAEEKIKREQREANIFELKEQKDFDKEEELEKLKVELEKRQSKRTQKALMKREKNYVYEDDSEGNPYSSESESEDSETERVKEEERKKAEEQQQAQGKTKEEAPIKPPSAPSSTKGTSTPSKPKQTDPLRKGILKRPGSPNLSEASGSESSRKKLKKKHPPESAPIDAPPKPINQHLARAAGSTSDGETSDAGRKKLKIRLAGSAANSRPTSPNGSRASSPAPSRPVTTAPAPASTGPVTLPSNEEIRSKIDPEGISLRDLMKKFSTSLMTNPRWMELLKANSRYDKEVKKLFPKTST